MPRRPPGDMPRRPPGDPGAPRVPRLAVVRCPHWPVVAAAESGTDPADPVAVVHANRVIACSLAATSAGVRIGHRRREAQRRCPTLRLVDDDPARDRRAFQDVVAAVADLVPRLEIAEPGTVTFPTRGPSRYVGGDDALAERVRALVVDALGDRVAVAGPPGVGIADGRFAATVAAHRAIRADRPLVVPDGGSATFLAPCPVRWLVVAGLAGAGTGPGTGSTGSATDDLVGLLLRLGIRTLGDLAALPAPDVLARFGSLGSLARQVASGLDDRPPDTEDPPPGRGVAHDADEPVQHLDALVFIGRGLASRFVAGLAADGRVCTELLVTAETEHGERSERLWTRSTGLSVAAVVERIRWQLDGWATSGDITAGVVRLALDAVAVRPDDGLQLGLWGGRTEQDDWAHRATARLAGLLGEQQVLVPAWQGGRVPSETYRWVPALGCDPEAARERVTPPSPEVAGPWPGGLPPPSPSVVHDPAPEIAVVDATGAPVVVGGRGAVSAAPAGVRIGSRDDPVVAWAGPWVLEERWWDAVRARRTARFQFLTASGRAYLAAVERQRWWLLAEYA